MKKKESQRSVKNYISLVLCSGLKLLLLFVLLIYSTDLIAEKKSDAP